MRLLLDEHLSPSIAVELRRRGHDVVAVAERPDLRRLADDRLWRVTRTEGRAFVTMDVGDFHPLASRDMAIGARHAGLVLVHVRRYGRGDRDTGAIVAALSQLLDDHPGAHALAGRVVWLEAPPAQP